MDGTNLATQNPCIYKGTFQSIRELQTVTFMKVPMEGVAPSTPNVNSRSDYTVRKKPNGKTFP